MGRRARQSGQRRGCRVPDSSLTHGVPVRLRRSGRAPHSSCVFPHLDAWTCTTHRGGFRRTRGLAGVAATYASAFVTISCSCLPSGPRVSKTASNLLLRVTAGPSTGPKRVVAILDHMSGFYPSATRGAARVDQKARCSAMPRVEQGVLHDGRLMRSRRIRGPLPG
jgi:hypothetical protein